MKALNYIQNRPGRGVSFDKAPEGRMMFWMHPKKAIRTLAALAAFAVATGCETEADPAPKTTVVIDPQPVAVAQSQTAAPSVTTTNLPVAEKKESVTSAPAA